jgi:hypothetical protein
MNPVLSNHNVLEKITTLFNYQLSGTTLPRKFGDFVRKLDFLFVQCQFENLSLESLSFDESESILSDRFLQRNCIGDNSVDDISLLSYEN